MSNEQLLEAKQATEEAIFRLLQAFHESTGLHPQTVIVQKDYTVNPDHGAIRGVKLVAEL